MEFGERLQIVLESFTLKQRLDTGFQLVGDLLNLIEPSLSVISLTLSNWER